MNELFLYNPENDIALACDTGSRFTPPRQAALLARWGAPLIWWMGDSGDYVLTAPFSSSEEENRFRQWLEGVEKLRGSGGPQFINNCKEARICCAVPWGWSRYAIRCLYDAGVPQEAVSHMENNMDTLRLLSHRRSAGILNKALTHSLSPKWGCLIVSEPADEFFSTAEAKEHIDVNGTSVYIKSPWSSSGRGVVCCNNIPADKILGRCDAVIRKQGSVIIERGRDKILDFAMLFRADADGRVRYYGMSRFFNERGTGYTGNLIRTNDHICSELACYLPEPLIEDVQDCLCTELSLLLAGHYTGYLGVDMMVILNGGEYALVPCVELNLRMTMGIVAHRLCSLTGREGIMRVFPGKKTTATPGALPLVPENPYFNIDFLPS